MMKTYKGVRVRLLTQSSKQAASDVNSGTPLAAASKICDIPRRTLRVSVSREGSLLKNLRWNTLLPADAEKQPHQIIICLQQVDSQVCSSNMQGTQRAESVEMQNGRKGLVCFLRRSPCLTLRSAENVSYGWLMMCCGDTLHGKK
jgi:hypothetical protein